MLGLSLDEAKNIALVAATAFAILAIAAIWVMKTIVLKVVIALLLVMLAFAAWSQRESLQECADQVQANVSASVTDATSPSTSPPLARPLAFRHGFAGSVLRVRHDGRDMHVLRRRRDHSVTLPSSDARPVIDGRFPRRREVDARHHHRRQGSREHRPALDPTIPADARASLRGEHHATDDRDRGQRVRRPVDPGRR